MAILEGKTEWLVKDITRQMERAAEDLRFEEAALFRDRLATLESVRDAQAVGSHHGEDRDVFALYREERLAVLTVVRIRRGRIAETTNFTFSDIAIEDDALLESALEQFYRSGREIPEEVVLPLELPNAAMLEEILSERRGRVVHFEVPQRGIRFRMLSLAQLNARQHYVASFDADSRNVELAKELAKVLSLKQVPRRIECVDISNFQGSDIVGAVVVFFDGVPDKKSYRRYKLSFQSKPDDFAAIYEVVRRRLERGLAEGDLPDLLIIDGGAAQLAKALQARDELKLSLEIVSLAKMRAEREARSAFKGTSISAKKKPERIFLEGKEEPLVMDESKPVTHFVQRMRDEVHRYVITFHRQTRARRVLLSILDGIPGVGPERKRRLLKRYGSVQKLKGLSAEELSMAGKMPLPVAERVLETLNEKRREESEDTV
jgi:excinuclease ABC subunit C